MTRICREIYTQRLQCDFRTKQKLQTLRLRMTAAKWIVSIIGCNLIFSTLYIEYSFVKHYITAKNVPFRKILFYPALVMFIFCSCALASIVFQVISDGLVISQTLSGSFYGLQYYTLLFVSIIRINIVFKDTQFQLAKCTVNTYKCIFCTLFVQLLAIAPIQVIFQEAPIIILIFIALILLGALGTNISLSVLFVYKLIKVNKNEHTQKNNGYLIDTITKNTILTVTSNAVTILVILGLILRSMVSDDVDWVFVMNVLLQFLDVYTNFICIAFTFRHFSTSYNRVCGLCDSKCKKCCSSMYTSQTLAEMQDIQIKHDPIEKSESPGSSPASSEQDMIEMTI